VGSVYGDVRSYTEDLGYYREKEEIVEIDQQALKKYVWIKWKIILPALK